MADAVAGYTVIKAVAMACMGWQGKGGGTEHLFELFVFALFLFPVGMDEV